MKKNLIFYFVLIALLATMQTVTAGQLTINNDDTMANVLAGQKGKKITITLTQGEELSGTVANITDELLHLEQLTGKEFYDAVIAVKEISAVIIRTKE